MRWMACHEHQDPKYGHVYRYHSRSNSHSNALCRFIFEDLLEKCTVLRQQASNGEVAYGIDIRHTWPGGKQKTLDLAIGIPSTPPEKGSGEIALVKQFSRVLLSCEAKSVMTEHGKSQPRVFDELSSSHEIVHRDRPEAIAAGVAVVNIAQEFVSPLRQKSKKKIHVTKHNQPHVAERMVQHLRGLQVREKVEDGGFDAYCSIVIDCDNLHDASLWLDPPAPQAGDIDHYDTFISRMVNFYTERFSSL